MKRNLFAPLTLAMADEPSLRLRIVRILRANVNRETLPPKRFAWVAVGVTLAVLPLAAFQNGNARRTEPHLIELRAVDAQPAQVFEVRGEAITIQDAPAPAQTIEVTGQVHDTATVSVTAGSVVVPSAPATVTVAPATAATAPQVINILHRR